MVDGRARTDGSARAAGRRACGPRFRPGAEAAPPQRRARAPRPEVGFYPAGLRPQHTGPPAGECAAIGSISSLPWVGALLSRDGSWIRAKLIRVMPSSASLTHPLRSSKDVTGPATG